MFEVGQIPAEDIGLDLQIKATDFTTLLSFSRHLLTKFTNLALVELYINGF